LNSSTTLICFESEIIKEIEQNNRSVSIFVRCLKDFFLSINMHLQDSFLNNFSPDRFRVHCGFKVNSTIRQAICLIKNLYLQDPPHTITFRNGYVSTMWIGVTRLRRRCF
jgi:hypothetical protein